jgi:hypothetical protein
MGLDEFKKLSLSLLLSIQASDMFLSSPLFFSRSLFLHPEIAMIELLELLLEFLEHSRWLLWMLSEVVRCSSMLLLANL